MNYQPQTPPALRVMEWPALLQSSTASTRSYKGVGA